MDVMNSILDERNLRKDEEGAEQEKTNQEARRKGEKPGPQEPNEKKKMQSKRLHKDMQNKLKHCFKGTNIAIVWLL